MVLVISSPAGEHPGRVLHGREDFASDLAFQAPDDLGLARSHSRLPPHFRLGTAIMAKPDRYDAVGNRISIQRTTPPSHSTRSNLDVLEAGNPPPEDWFRTHVTMGPQGGHLAQRKHTPEQVLNKLRQAEAAISEGSTVAEASRMIGVSKQTLYRWRAGHRGWRIDQARRLKQLETENARLQRELEHLSLHSHTLKQVAESKLVSPARRRHCVERVRTVFGVSERRACRVLGQHRSTQRRQPTSVSKPSGRSLQAATNPSQIDA